MRLYHGWYSGITPTENRRALERLQSENLLPTKEGNTVFDWATMFGDVSLDAYDFRRHRRAHVHFPDTLRTDFERRREKMVDTALACDVLHSSRSDPEEWRIVMAEDDDVVPPVFMAEKWAKHRGGRTMILRIRTDPGHINLDGMLLSL